MSPMMAEDRERRVRSSLHSRLACSLNSRADLQSSRMTKVGSRWLWRALWRCVAPTEAIIIDFGQQDGHPNAVIVIKLMLSKMN
jgi:hypothetical protein